MIKLLLVLILALSALGCEKHRTVKLPPVKEGWKQPKAMKFGYIVQKNDSLYSIAWAFGVDYRYLAKINNLQPPYSLRYGQRLRIVDSATSASKYSAPVSEQKQSKVNYKPLKGWIWPAAGKVTLTFNKDMGGNKGVDIAGSYSQDVLASHSGTVVYSGSGIRSYGNLIIIKHNDDYLSAYAYNQSLLVHEGQIVKTGQKIATMGHNNDGHPCLHFEIRLFGKPVDPLVYLPRKK